MLNRRYRIAADLLNGANSMFYSAAARTAIPAAQEQDHYELTDYWAGNRAGNRTRGFQSLNKTMLMYLPAAVQARARAG
jgi:hypothetical protein